MDDFVYRGNIPASKSVLNRVLIAKSYFPRLQIQGDSICDDVMFMKSSLDSLPEKKDRTVFEAGEGGTTFRFLSLRLARLVGTRYLKAHPRLMRRPQKEIVELLKQLGVEAEIQTDGLRIVSEGWKKPKGEISVNCAESSQYASALILNAWGLDFDLRLSLVGKKVSEAYFELTVEILKKLGMEIHRSGDRIEIPAFQDLLSLDFFAEPDMSSIFTMAAAGALCGEVEIQNFPLVSRQPDLIFLEIFKKMGIEFTRTGQIFHLKRTRHLLPVEWNLNASPDLFPVLAILCSFAEGESRLLGAPQLAHKESNRIERVSDLLNVFSVPHQKLKDGMIIQGGHIQKPFQGFSFSPDQDHRMVMAAALMKLRTQDKNFHILSPEVVNKSWPEFFEMIGIKP